MLMKFKLDLGELDKIFGLLNIMVFDLILLLSGKLWGMDFLFLLLSVQNRLLKATEKEEFNFSAPLEEIL